MVRTYMEVRYISVLVYAAVGTGLSSSTGHHEIPTTTLYGLMQIESHLVSTRFFSNEGSDTRTEYDGISVDCESR